MNRLISYFKTCARNTSLPLLESSTPIQPLIIGDNTRTVLLSQSLLSHGFLVGPIRPPTVPENSARLRITITSSHTKSQVDSLLETLEREYHRLV